MREPRRRSVRRALVALLALPTLGLTILPQASYAVAPPAPPRCDPVSASYSNTTPLDIPTGAIVVTSTIDVQGAGSFIADVDAKTFITHTAGSDVDMTLKSPAGTVVTLTTDNGSTLDNVFNGTVWDDDANPAGQVPYIANNGLATDQTYVNLTTATPLVAEEAMGAFVGENPNGVWTLTISDDIGTVDGGTLNSWELDIDTYALPPVVTNTTGSNTTPVTIPTTVATVSSVITVSGADPVIHDVDATTNITHTFASDLDVTLQSPLGTIVTLTTDNGSSLDNVFNGTVWDDDANPAGQVPYTANNGVVSDNTYADLTPASPLVPEEAMAAFIGENPNGSWTLTISDDASGDGGSLNSWSLDIDTLAVQPAIATATASNSTPVTIPSTAPPVTVTSTISVSGAGSYLSDLDARTSFLHTASGDLDVTLKSPAGTIVTLTTDNGSTLDNVFNGTVWDDDANPAGQVPYIVNNGVTTDQAYVNLTTATPLAPEEPLGAFVGENPNGMWTLTVSDDAPGVDGGQLTSWSLGLETYAIAPPMATATGSNAMPVTIPAVIGTVSSTIAISGAGTSLSDVNAKTFITHTFSSDIDMTLRSPAGTVVTLSTDNGSSSDNVFNGTVWDDDANPAGQVPYTANNGLASDQTYVNLVTATPLSPEEGLSAFIGEDPNGTWTLTISDDATGDGGTLSSWSLDIQTAGSCNRAPTAVDQAVQTLQDVPLPITLTGSDPDADTLSFAVTTNPANGTLTGAPPSLVYTPNTGFVGTDSFDFTVDDGFGGTDTGTVTITVTSNLPPTADDQSVWTDEDTSLPITLTGSDPESDPITFSIESGPSNGTLSGAAPNVTYNPNGNFNGSDSFDFKVQDSNGGFDIGTIDIMINAVNDAPMANAQSVITPEDTPKAITLTGSDVDGDAVSFSVTVDPVNGTLSGTAPNLSYSPSLNFHGSDSFTFQVDDGNGGTDTAVVSITVTAVNDNPVADEQSGTTMEDTPLAITLTGSDVDGDVLSFSVTSLPAHGTLSGTAPNIIYTPAADYFGTDSFDFQVSDGMGGTDSATVSLTITSAPLIATKLETDPTIARLAPTIEIFASDLQATLTRGDSGAPLAGKELIFKIGGVEICRATTNANGFAQCGDLEDNINATLAGGYTAEFLEDADLAATSDAAGVVEGLI